LKKIKIVYVEFCSLLELVVLFYMVSEPRDPK